MSAARRARDSRAPDAAARESATTGSVEAGAAAVGDRGSPRRAGAGLASAEAAPDSDPVAADLRGRPCRGAGAGVAAEAASVGAGLGGEPDGAAAVGGGVTDGLRGRPCLRFGGSATGGQAFRARIASVSWGTIVNWSPTTPKSAMSKIGASGSLLIATMVLAVCMPTRCWVAPEMPIAT